jgi:hypothetical protein
MDAPTPESNPTPRQMIAMSPELFQQVSNFLMQQPMFEVEKLVNELRQGVTTVQVGAP